MKNSTLSAPIQVSFRDDPFHMLRIDRLSNTMTLQTDEDVEFIKCHDYFEILWIIQGRGNYCIDLQKVEITGNQVFFIRPGLIHRLEIDEKEILNGYSIKFEKSFIENLHQDYNLTNPKGILKIFAYTKVMLISKDTQEDLKEILAKIHLELSQSYDANNEFLRLYLAIFLISLKRHSNSGMQVFLKTKKMELVDDFMELLERNFIDKKKVSDYASDLSITPNYLNEIVKKIAGKSAGQLIRDRIVLEAKRQATYSRLCMKEVAYYLGFADPGHFSKFFKSVTGENFSDYKNQKSPIIDKIG